MSDSAKKGTMTVCLYSMYMYLNLHGQQLISFYFLYNQVLLVTSINCPDEWIIPAGGVEAGEEFQDAAVREVSEEVSELP